jgi:glycosyltransferase involved in cell wall biosynthesis
MAAFNAGRSPLVTVVTPAYNVAKYVGETVDSVLRQTFRDFEYLVVDDGSVDNSVDVVKAHVGDDPRFRLVAGEHRGLSAARNAGIREAKGEYIAFLDGDDRWHPRFLARQLQLIQSLPPDVGVVFCRSRLVLENGTLVFFQWQRVGRYDFDDFLVNNNPARNGSSLLIRKSCFADVGGFGEDLRYVEDLDMWLRIAENSKTPVLWASKYFLVDMRLRPGSITRDRAGLESALSDMLESQTAKLRRLPAGLAYVRPALIAFKYGKNEDLAECWAGRARSVSSGQLARTVPGIRLLFWDTLPRPARRAVRSAQYSARELLKDVNLRLRGGPGSMPFSQSGRGGGYRGGAAVAGESGPAAAGAGATARRVLPVGAGQPQGQGEDPHTAD